MNEHEPPARLPSGQFPTTAPGTDSRGTDGRGAGGSRSERNVTATWWYTFTSMAAFALLMPLLMAFVQWGFVLESGGSRTPLLTIADLLAVAGALTAVYACCLLRHGIGHGWPGPAGTLLICVPPVLVWVLTLWIPGAAITGSFPLWIAVNVLAPLLRGRSRPLVLVAGLVLFGIHWWAGRILTGVDGVESREGPMLFSLVFFAAMCPVVFLFSAWWWNIVVQLNDARRDAAQLAVARERLRFASDLHDIQGHHLQVIALKAELAERLLERSAGREPDAGGSRELATARENIHEVRTLARTALEETRAIVRDLREVSLEEEIANAKDVLEASGATTTVRGVHVRDPAARTLLGLAVREGATNILRHASSATKVSIVLEATGGRAGGPGGQRLVLTNDGAEAPRPEDPAGDRTGGGAPGATGPTSGTGLSGLDRRFASSGGTVTGRYDAGTFVLEAWLPAVPGEDPEPHGRNGRPEFPSDAQEATP